MKPKNEILKLLEPVTQWRRTPRYHVYEIPTEVETDVLYVVLNVCNYTVGDISYYFGDPTSRHRKPVPELTALQIIRKYAERERFVYE